MWQVKAQPSSLDTVFNILSSMLHWNINNIGQGYNSNEKIHLWKLLKLNYVLLLINLNDPNIYQQTISYSDNKSKKKEMVFTLLMYKTVRKFNFTKYFNLKESSVLNHTFISWKISVIKFTSLRLKILSSTVPIKVEIWEKRQK